MCPICEIICVEGNNCLCPKCKFAKQDIECIICGKDRCTSDICGVQAHLAYVRFCYLCMDKYVNKPDKTKLCSFHLR